MATYNGEKYIKTQLKSILCQIGNEDELIISDDSSTDDTLAIIENLNDVRIKLYKNGKYHSPIYNFENSLSKAKNDIIILADQDDEWLPGRIDEIIEIFNNQPKISLIVNKCNIIDQAGNIIRNSHFADSNPVNHSFLWNLLKNPYLGCCMAFRKNVLDLALPFPKKIAMHDIWIGLIAQLNGKCIYHDKALVNYRRHGNNVSPNGHYYPLWYKIYYRIRILIFIIDRQVSRSAKNLSVLCLTKLMNYV
jgi:glycosyltransferase involved in cell wall biosynthesis